MGICSSCFGDSSVSSGEVSQTEMRARQLAAAEQRANNAANRGIGNQAKVQQWQKRQEAIEEMEAKAGKSPQNNDNPLRWQVDR